MRTKWGVLAGLALAVLTAACGHAPNDTVGSGQDGADGELAGRIEIDGSSTVEPVTSAVSEEFAAVAPEVQAPVAVSGTGGGFERFCAGETDISNASRPIKNEEKALCEEAGVAFTELRVGTDALTMVTSPETDFVTCLTTEEVAKIFGPDSSAATWADVNPQFPDEPLQVFGPGADSGTYDFMVEDILDAEGSRQDYNASEDDNIIAQGVQGTPASWGFFGYAFYQESSDSLKAIQYDAGDGCVTPSVETAQDGSYGMTRPLFIYVNNDSLQRPVVEEYVRFYLEEAPALVEEVGYIPETADSYAQAQTTFESAINS